MSKAPSIQFLQQPPGPAQTLGNACKTRFNGLKSGWDFSQIHIELFGLAEPETTTVIIRDNGTGMTLSDLEDKWLSLAVDHKGR